MSRRHRRGPRRHYRSRPPPTIQPPPTAPPPPPPPKPDPAGSPFDEYEGVYFDDDGNMYEDYGYLAQPLSPSSSYERPPPHPFWRWIRRWVPKIAAWVWVIETCIDQAWRIARQFDEMVSQIAGLRHIVPENAYRRHYGGDPYDGYGQYY